MSTQAHDSSKADSNPTAAPRSSQFQTRPFDQASVNSAFAPVTNQFQSRPFAAPVPSQQFQSQQAAPDIQAQLEQAKRFNYDLSEINLFSTGATPAEAPSSSVIQPKLAIGQPGDKYEKEADQVAAQVMSISGTPEPSPQVQRLEEEDSSVQRWSLAQSITPVVQRQVDEQVQMQALVQRAFQAGENEASGDLEGRLNASKGEGSALAPEVRAYMEPRFGADFSSVRVHTGSGSVQMNRELGAQAFTHGSDVYFGAGKSPGNNELTAHELTHVMQQMGESQIQRQPVPAPAPGVFLPSPPAPPINLVKELQTLIDGATWKEIRKRVYPKESAPGIQRAKERQAGKLPDLTGLGQIKTLNHFAQEIHSIQKNWNKWSPDQRVQELGKAANVELKNAKVPGFLVVNKVETEFKGFFSPREWKFLISKALVSGSSLSNDDAAEVTNTTLHEGRHAEQHFLAARFSAGVNKKSSEEISTEQGIPKVIADQAVKKKFNAKTDPTVATLGKQMYQAMVIDSAKNQAISNDDGLVELADKRRQAQTALNNLTSTGTPQDIADAIACRDALRQQIAVVEQKYTLYRNIPYEADAHEVGDAAEQAFRGWP